MAGLTSVVEEAQVRQDEPPLFPQFHAWTVLQMHQRTDELYYTSTEWNIHTLWSFRMCNKLLELYKFNTWNSWCMLTIVTGDYF